MIIKNIKKSFKQMIFNPLIFFPMLVVVLVSIISTNITSFVLERPLSEMFLDLNVFMTGDLIIILLQRYWFEFLIMLLTGFIAVFVNIVAFITISKFAKKEKLIDSIDFAVKNFQKAFSLTFFFFIMSIILFFILNLFLIILNIIYSILPNEINYYIALFIVPIIFIALIIIYITKLGFVLPAIIDNNLKESIKKSWVFTNDKFLQSFFYIMIVFVIITIFQIIFNNLDIILETELLFVSIGEIISLTFIGLAISNYYFN